MMFPFSQSHWFELKDCAEQEHHLFSPVRKINCFASSKISYNIRVYRTSDFNRIINLSSFPLKQHVLMVHIIQCAAELSGGHKRLC